MSRPPVTRATTATGETPRVDPLMPDHLPEMQPDHLPEFSSAGATTGVMPALKETPDPDKLADSTAPDESQV